MSEEYTIRGIRVGIEKVPVYQTTLTVAHRGELQAKANELVKRAEAGELEFDTTYRVFLIPSEELESLPEGPLVKLKTPTSSATDGEGNPYNGFNHE